MTVLHVTVLYVLVGAEARSGDRVAAGGVCAGGRLSEMYACDCLTCTRVTLLRVLL